MKSLLLAVVMVLSVTATTQAQSIEQILWESVQALGKLGHSCSLDDTTSASTADEFTLHCTTPVGSLKLKDIQFIIDRKNQSIESQVVTVGSRYPYQWTCSLAGKLDVLFQQGLTLEQKCDTSRIAD
ncbi:MAG: hypothetical protein A2622_10060 [Bdellovibrionales bacterium RIFCSPHIGHO2_01_FULL_40_29]|nr:MAG: hypothetical protein A2622_10060 [Bdellovibrionales bacterium RIFCSPHIGHO2_01_FULL_40_29]OFZ32409.1 MAG: hypothetical protein A3D17_12600 [Bdellovibrionales bacterium RIFCSPHIGHO2_02_FULL_40_15]